MPGFLQKSVALAVLALMPAFAAAADKPGANSPDGWQTRLAKELPLLGHRNWIAVVDSAYPLQTRAGIETLDTEADHLEVVRAVLEQVTHSRHVRPVIFTDAELKAIPEIEAKGVSEYRQALANLLSQAGQGKIEPQSLPHEEIISKLDEAGKTFHILVLKTRMAIPYTSVFVRLDCGYWTAEQEKNLRDAMAKK